MKKIISFNFKSVKNYFDTFGSCSCCHITWFFNQVFLKNKMQLLFYLLLCVLILDYSPSYGQIIVQGGTVQSNFGVDADVRAKTISVNNDGTEPAQIGVTDDWFSNTGIGSGLGVIDVTSPYALGQISNLNLLSNSKSFPILKRILSFNGTA